MLVRLRVLSVLLLAVLALGPLTVGRADGPDLDALAKKLKGKSPSERLDALAEATKLGPAAKKLTPLLCEAVLDPASKTSRAALDALDKVEPELGKAVTALWTDKEPANQLAAAQQLRDLNAKGVAAAPVMAAQLKRVLVNPKFSTELRLQFATTALDGLADWADDSPNALKALLGCASVSNPLVRMVALNNLGSVAEGDDDARKEIAPILLAALNDPAVRLTAVQAVGFLGDDGKSALPTLKKFKADNKNPELSKVAGEAIDRITAAQSRILAPTKEFDVAAKEKQVKAALAFLVKDQLEDGSWDSGMGENGPASVATTAFCGLALLASGESYDKPLSKAAAYITDNLFQDKGKIKVADNWDQSNWKIALGGLFLAEYYAYLKQKDAKARPDELVKTLERVIEEAGKRMETSGGWGHTPKLKNPLGYVELEVVSNWMLMTLGICQRLDLKVPTDKIKLAAQFVAESCKSGRGAVGYSPRDGQKGIGAPGRTGGAICGYALLDLQTDELYPRMVAAWRKEAVDSGEGHGSVALGFLGSALGARQIGGKDWKAFEGTFGPKILAAANEDGSFKFLAGKTVLATGFDHKMSKAYNTGIYTLLLELDGSRLKFLGQKQGGKAE